MFECNTSYIILYYIFYHFKLLQKQSRVLFCSHKPYKHYYRMLCQVYFVHLSVYVPCVFLSIGITDLIINIFSFISKSSRVHRSLMVCSLTTSCATLYCNPISYVYFHGDYQINRTHHNLKYNHCFGDKRLRESKKLRDQAQRLLEQDKCSNLISPPIILK